MEAGAGDGGGACQSVGAVVNLDEAVVVMQCAASKAHCAGTFKAPDGRRVCFVAHPERAPADGVVCYARPDDDAGGGETWRDKLREYNRRQGGDNPLGLKQASELYSNPVYGDLRERLGAERFFILSAGWGLARSDFLLPDYNITFSYIPPEKKQEHCRRYWERDANLFKDFSMLPDDTDAPVLFFGGKGYRGPFAELTSGVQAPRDIFFTGKKTPDVPGCRLVRFETTTNTNWQYECAKAFLNGTLQLPEEFSDG